MAATVQAVPTQPAVLYQVEAFYDGDCPLCTKEVALLRGLDRHGRIRFTDFTAPGFDAAAVGLTHDELMARMHGRLPDGALIEGVEVFRRLYAAVGFGPVVALTRLPGLAQACEAGLLTTRRARGDEGRGDRRPGLTACRRQRGQAGGW